MDNANNDPNETSRYRSLFEGSQTSLSDLASRQSQAFSRIGRFRSAIVTVLRRNFMEHCAQAEANIGCRLNDTDDEILIAYLDAFVGAASRGDQRATLKAMREAVQSLGVPLRGEEPLLWVEQIYAYRQTMSTQQEQMGEAVAPSTAPVVHDGGEVDKSEDALTAEDYWSWDKLQPGQEPVDNSNKLPSVAEQTVSGGLGGLFADVFKPVLWENELGQTKSVVEQWTPSPIAPNKKKSDTQTTIAVANTTSGQQSDGVVKPVAPRPRRKQSERAEGAPDNALNAATETSVTATIVEPKDLVLNAPLRPELFPATGGAKKRQRRTVKTTAQRPSENDTLPIPVVDGTEELTDSVRQSLLAAVSIPRPVFTRDLVGIAGSQSIVDAWETECRNNVDTSPIRFVAPKSRHRLRGRLVAIDQETIKPADWWHQAVVRYRAGRLYELGVLLHRVGDEVVAFSLEDYVAMFRLNTPRGLVGIIVVMDAGLAANSAARDSVALNLGKMLSERLTLLAVLTTSAEPGVFENMIETLETLAVERDWQPTMPVVAAKSWEYADDRGSSAIMVLGQA